MGLYQLRYLTRIPPRAAVDESVKLVKAARLKSASGFVNSILRRSSDNPAEESYSNITDDHDRISISLSHPRWLLERWIRQFGEEEALLLAEANNRQPVVAFRINTLKVSDAPLIEFIERGKIEARPSLITPGAYVTGPGGALAGSKACVEGKIYIQDEGSQLVSALLDPQPGDFVLDLCAAPGSKTTHIAALGGGRCRILACDLHLHRLRSLASTCKNLGAGNIEALAVDGTRPLPFTGIKFDRVLVDAPCSGTGTLRENPEIKWRLKPEDIERLSQVQFRLLQNASEFLKDGGRLVYSTCSIEPEENEHVVEMFLENNSGYSVLRPVIQGDIITSEGFVRTFPHRHGAGGFFAAILQK